MSDMSETLRKKEYLTTTEAAQMLAVSPDTVLKWARAGKIQSHRTRGGHFRIPFSELDSSEARLNGERLAPFAQQLPSHQYCWEYLSRGGETKAECHDCITYRSRTKRCYELRDLPGGLGCLRAYCQESCEECEYFKLVREQKLSILMIGSRRGLLVDRGDPGEFVGMQVRFADNEYMSSQVIETFRPDYIVIDHSLGKKRTMALCGYLFDDPRIPVARIIVAAKSRRLAETCNRDIFSWITRPFTMEQLRSCIEGAV
jgi:excisionase family DNA binding protein